MANVEIIIRGGVATTKKPDGTTVEMSVELLFQRAAPPRIDSCGIALPREVRFAYTRGPLTVLVCEYPAGPYTLSWIANDSPSRFGIGTKYRQVTLSLPYVIVLAAFEGTRLSNFNECFFRTAPLTDIDVENELLFPGLLNCSRYKPPDGRPLSWICTQHLDRTAIRREQEPRRRIRLGLKALRHCLLESSFNYSSDEHEYSSWFSESRGVDKRVETVDQWHEETQKDRFVGLDIPWLKTDMNLEQIINRIYQNHGITGACINDARQLARLLINSDKKK